MTYIDKTCSLIIQHRPWDIVHVSGLVRLLGDYIKHVGGFGLPYAEVRVCVMSGCWWMMSLTHWGWDKMAAIFQTTFSNAFSWMKMYEFFIEISLKFVPQGPINNIPALVQIMAWRRPGISVLYEPSVMIKHVSVILVLDWEKTGTYSPHRKLSISWWMMTWQCQVPSHQREWYSNQFKVYQWREELALLCWGQNIPRIDIPCIARTLAAMIFTI